MKNTWKIVGATAAVAVLGIGGVGLSDNGDDLKLPDAINLRDRVPVTEAAYEQTAPEIEVVPVRLAGDSLDSPFDGSDGNLSPLNGQGSMQSVSLDSPDAPVANQSGSNAGDSPDATDSLSLDSPDGPTRDQSQLSLSDDSPDSPSVDTATIDSPDSFDSEDETT